MIRSVAQFMEIENNMATLTKFKHLQEEVVQRHLLAKQALAHFHSVPLKKETHFTHKYSICFLYRYQLIPQLNVYL